MNTRDVQYYADAPTTPLGADDSSSQAAFEWLKVIDQRRRGIQFLKDAQFAAAVKEFDGILSVCRTYAEVWLRRGIALEGLQQFDLAYESIAQANILTPVYPEARQRLMRLAQALGRAPSVLTPWPENPKPRWGGRFIYRIKQRFRKKRELPTEEELRAELLHSPRSVDAAVLLGWRFVLHHRHIEAECFFRYAALLEPWSSYAASFLSRTAASFNRHGDASAIAAAALKAGAEDKGLSTVALWCARAACEWADHDRWVSTCLTRLKKNPTAMDPFVALHFYDDPVIQQHISVAFGPHRANGAQPIPNAFRKSADRPITVGYISGDFRVHPLAFLIGDLFARHDRRRFRVHAYSVYSGEPNKITDRIRRSCDKFVDLATTPPSGAAEIIMRDQVDILVDLTGFAQSPPYPILARRPAPIQVNYLGYPGTMGSPQVDYIIVDKTVVPSEQAQWYTEKLVHMPDCYQINDRKNVINKAKDSRADLGLPSEGVVYCSFNDPRKISPDVFRVWMRILKRVPGSVLWLLTYTEEVSANLRREAENAGVDPERVKFAPKLDFDDHLARYRHCDLFLDTLPYNAHTTASDALWGGCPLVTCQGKTFPARVAASILHAAGLPDLITTSLEGYEELAVRIGLNPELRADLKKRVAAAKASSPLFDAPRFVAHLESAFEKMWDLYASGLPPTAFEVRALKAQN